MTFFFEVYLPFNLIVFRRLLRDTPENDFKTQTNLAPHIKLLH